MKDLIKQAITKNKCQACRQSLTGKAMFHLQAHNPENDLILCDLCAAGKMLTVKIKCVKPVSIELRGVNKRNNDWSQND